MRKHIELKRFNQGTALTTGTLALPPLVIEGLAEFNGSFDRLCLKAGTAAIEAMLAADAEQFCGKRYQRHADRQGYRWGLIGARSGALYWPVAVDTALSNSLRYQQAAAGDFRQT